MISIFPSGYVYPGPAYTTSTTSANPVFLTMEGLSTTRVAYWHKSCAQEKGVATVPKEVPRAKYTCTGCGRTIALRRK